jgi:prophage antirepressor-like protein
MGDNKIQLFEDKRIRTAWDEEKEEWFFSVADVVEVLTDSADVKQYIKKMRSRDPELHLKWGTICTPVEMIAADGKNRRVTAANAEGVLRLIQSIPSPKAEPFKAWLARVGSERINETIDPELTIERALETYLKKGYTREWINQRLQAIQVRKELTDEWDNRGVKKGVEYAILTDEISKA